MWYLDNAHRFRLCVKQDIFKLTVWYAFEKSYLENNFKGS